MGLAPGPRGTRNVNHLVTDAGAREGLLRQRGARAFAPVAGAAACRRLRSGADKARKTEGAEGWVPAVVGRALAGAPVAWGETANRPRRRVVTPAPASPSAPSVCLALSSPQ